MWIEIAVTWVLEKFGIVTPLAGVWIEIVKYEGAIKPEIVTPLAGVWIEIYKCFLHFCCLLSLPLRECGLK